MTKSKFGRVLREIIGSKLREMESIEASGQFDIYKAEALITKRHFFDRISGQGLYIIGEIKKYSPFNGDIRPNTTQEDIVKIARIYEKEGAAAISVLTNKYFKAGLKDLAIARDAVNIPCLRKDFIVDPRQIYESRFVGADAILLLASIPFFTSIKLKEYIETASSLGMTSIVECHTKDDVEKALKAEAKVIGINNRNLNNGSIEMRKTAELSDKIPKEVLVISESGIKSYNDIISLQNQSQRRINAYLVGSCLMDEKVNPTLKDMARYFRYLLPPKRKF